MGCKGKKKGKKDRMGFAKKISGKRKKIRGGKSK